MGKRIRILYVIDSLLVWAGTEKHLFKLVSKIDQKLFDCYVCTFNGSDHVLNIFKNAGINAFRLSLKRIYGISGLIQAMRLAHFIKKNEIDIVQNAHFSAEILGTLVAHFARVPVIISSKRDMGILDGNLHSFALRVIEPLVDRTVCVSKAVQRVLSSRKLLHDSKATVIYNGVDLGEFAFAVNGVAAYKKKLGLYRNEPVIAMVANPRPVKDIETFVRAARKIVDTQPNIQFIIVGQDVYRESGSPLYSEQLKKLVAELGLSEHFFFIGARTDVNRLLSVVDICVLTSLSEGFSNTLIEYMAAAKPVVATAVGGNGEALIDGETGFLVPPRSPDRTAAAIITLLKDKDLAARMGHAGKKRIKKFFTLDLMVESYQTLYTESLAQALAKKTPPRVEYPTPIVSSTAG